MLDFCNTLVHNGFSQFCLCQITFSLFIKPYPLIVKGVFDSRKHLFWHSLALQYLEICLEQNILMYVALKWSKSHITRGLQRTFCIFLFQNILWTIKHTLCDSYTAGNFFPTVQGLIGYFKVTWHLTMKMFPIRISNQSNPCNETSSLAN